MKKGRWRDAKAMCPFYKNNSSGLICCEGMQEGCSVQQGFGVPQSRKDYMATYCRSNYEACWICKEHLRALGEL